MKQVCSGMHAVSGHGIVHRDLKPSNILINDNHNAIVVDFGLAKGPLHNVETQSGAIMGTPYYMSPEQAEDPRLADTRSDIYSFGATFYHVLTHCIPFDGESWFQILLRHKMEPLTPPRIHNPNLSASMNDCLERCMSKSPRDRFQSFSSLLQFLESTDVNESVWTQSEDPEVVQHLDRFRSSQSHYMDPHRDTSINEDVYHFSNGRICKIIFGNIVNQNVDAIVSSDDEMISMGGGVSRQIAEAAGEEYQKYAMYYAPIRPGRVVVTPGGKLHSKYVMQAITIGAIDNKTIYPTRDLINEIMDGCFYHADTLGLKTIAFPLLGTGVGRLSADICLEPIPKP